MSSNRSRKILDMVKQNVPRQNDNPNQTSAESSRLSDLEPSINLSEQEHVYTILENVYIQTLPENNMQVYTDDTLESEMMIGAHGIAINTDNGTQLNINNNQADENYVLSIENDKADRNDELGSKTNDTNRIEILSNYVLNPDKPIILDTDTEISNNLSLNNTDHPDQIIIKEYQKHDSNEENSDPNDTDSDNSYVQSSLGEDSNADSEEADGPKKRREFRKRKRNEKNWSVNVIKTARAKGAEYKTKKGKTIKAKSLKPPCSCKKKCYEKFSNEQRLRLFQDFYALNYSEQSQFLSTSMREYEKLRRTNPEKESRRNFSRKYLLKKELHTIEVCKQMFVNTFDLSLKRLRYIAEKCRASDSGICAPDKRGKHGNHPKISEEDKLFVIQHITKFPAYKSHYSRSHSAKRYLSPDLSIQQMYRLYVKECNDNGKQPVSDHFYRNVFVSEFNLSFHPPKNDTCGKCDKLEILIKASSDEGEKLNYVREKLEHVNAADEAYKEKRKDKENSRQNSNTITAMFDLQRCLPTPHLRSGIAFYKRQLWVFNLTVYQVMSDSTDSICFMWDETTSGRGGQEIASCLLKYIKGLPPTTTCINLYSDCCSGQNRNIHIATLLSLIFELLPAHYQLQEINHKFLVSGHTHLEADSIHASIEKAKKQTTMDIEMPRDWSTLVRTINRKGGIKVIDMTQDDFYNFSTLQKIHFINRKKNCDGENMSFLKAHFFKYTRNNPGLILYKNSFSEEEEFKKWDITKKKKTQSPTSIEKLLNFYPLPLPKKKLDDIVSLFPFIHPNSRLFYRNLRHNDNNSNEDDVCPTELEYDE